MLCICVERGKCKICILQKPQGVQGIFSFLSPGGSFVILGAHS